MSSFQIIEREKSAGTAFQWGTIGGLAKVLLVYLGIRLLDDWFVHPVRTVFSIHLGRACFSSLVTLSKYAFRIGNKVFRFGRQLAKDPTLFSFKIKFLPSMEIVIIFQLLIQAEMRAEVKLILNR